MKTKKSARKFAASGKLKQTIKARHKHRQVKKQIEGRKARRDVGRGRSNRKTPATSRMTGSDEGSDDEDVKIGEPRPTKKAGKRGGVEGDEDDIQQDMEVSLTLTD